MQGKGPRPTPCEMEILFLPSSVPLFTQLLSPGSYHSSVFPRSLMVLSNCQDSFPTSSRPWDLGFLPLRLLKPPYDSSVLLWGTSERKLRVEEDLCLTGLF